MKEEIEKLIKKIDSSIGQPLLDRIDLSKDVCEHATGYNRGYDVAMSNVSAVLKDILEKEEKILTVMGIDRDILRGTGSWVILKGNEFIANGEIFEPSRTKFDLKMSRIADVFSVDNIVVE